MIGASSEMLKRQFGPEIDTHEAVLRVNGHFSNSQLAPFIGTRTTLRLQPPYHEARYLKVMLLLLEQNKHNSTWTLPQVIGMPVAYGNDHERFTEAWLKKPWCECLNTTSTYWLSNHARIHKIWDPLPRETKEKLLKMIPHLGFGGHGGHWPDWPKIRGTHQHPSAFTDVISPAQDGSGMHVLIGVALNVCDTVDVYGYSATLKDLYKYYYDPAANTEDPNFDSGYPKRCFEWNEPNLPRNITQDRNWRQNTMRLQMLHCAGYLSIRKRADGPWLDPTKKPC